MGTELASSEVLVATRGSPIYCHDGVLVLLVAVDACMVEWVLYPATCEDVGLAEALFSLLVLVLFLQSKERECSSWRRPRPECMWHNLSIHAGVCCTCNYVCQY